MIKMTFDNINSLTGFANGNLFNNKKDVLDYFTIENMITMFNDCYLTQNELSKMAEIVIENNWHMEIIKEIKIRIYRDKLINNELRYEISSNLDINDKILTNELNAIIFIIDLIKESKLEFI